MRDTPFGAGEMPAECEAVIQSFEQAWWGPVRPDIDQYLPTPRPGHTRLLFELVHVDLDIRLRNGEAVRVEHYFERYPLLGQDQGAALDLIAAEYALRRAWQAGAEPEEYLQRFPQYADELRAQLGDGASGGPRRPAALREVRPTVPGYEVLRELGRGGMGVVYQARQAALGRVVALKTMLLPGGAASAEDLERFRREAEAIARLDHPHIVPVYEVGEDAGRPYFSMKFYPGGSLAQQVRGPSTDLRGHARLVETIARAVHHAHQRGILHRDLKPSNILLDEAGRPHVADFGLAKRLDAGAGATVASGVVGTPSYAAPEQAQRGEAVTTASDVYGLGAILYELLTGRPPFTGDNPLAVLMQVVNHPPRRPALGNPRVPVDLETICLKCLEKEPGRRYPGARELAEDLRRWRRGEPILARPVTSWGQACRWARRHPAKAGLSLATGLALVLAVVTLAVSNARIAREEADTAQALAEERQARAELVESLGRERRLLYLQRVALAARLWSSNQVAQAEKLLDECPPEFRHWEYDFVNARRRPHLASLDHGGPVYAVAYSPDGRHLASVGKDGAVKLWDVATGRTVPFAAGHGAFAVGLAFSPDGARLATAGASHVKVWDVATGKEVYRRPGGYWVAYSPDGRYLASAVGAAVRVWEAETGRELHTLSGDVNVVRHAAFSPDSKHLAVGGFPGWDRSPRGDEGTVRVWEVATGKPAGTPRKYGSPVDSLAYHGRQLLVGQASLVLVTDAETGQVRGRLKTPPRARARLALSPDGRHLAYSAPDHTVRVWDLRAGRETFTFRGHTAHVTAVAFHPHGRRLASCAGRAVKVWDLTREAEVRVLAPLGARTGRTRCLAFAPDGRRLAVAWGDGATVLDTATGREAFRLRGRHDVAYSPAGRHLATAGPEGGVTLWDAKLGREVRTLRGRGHVCHRLAFRPDGRRLASGAVDGGLEVWDPVTGARLLSWRGHAGPVEAVAFRPDGATLATAGADGGVCLWDAATGARRRRLGPPSHFSSVAFSPDGRLLAAAGADAVIRLWEVDTGRPVQALRGHTLRVLKVAFSPDGQRLVSGGGDGTARLWDVESGQELLSLPGAGRNVEGVAFSPDGRQIAAADGGVAKVWGAAPAQK